MASRERWFYDNAEMKVVNSYKHVGIFITTKISFSYACENLVSHGKKAVVDIMKTLHTFENHSMYVCFKLFDAQVQPIVLYGADIWGMDKHLT